MNFRTILLLNIASIVEAVIMKLLIGRGVIVYEFSLSPCLYNILSIVAVKNVLVLGGYQVYFWSQRNRMVGKRIFYLSPSNLDRIIPAIPEMFWIYSPIYYLFFSVSMFCSTNFFGAVLNAWLMLLHSLFWFFYFPTGVIKEFREQIRAARSDKITKYLMNLVHHHDSEANACPSMHCAFAVFLAFIAYPCYPVLSISFPILVSLSCLFTKQHLMIDIVPGFLLGALHGFIYTILLG